LTLPNRLPMPLSTARASAPTAVVSPLTATHPNPALTLVQKLHLIASQSLWKLQPTLLTAAINPPCPRTNFETPKQNA
jgi:hypothetical protein